MTQIEEAREIEGGVIMLVGGPEDQKSLWWNGGPIFEIAEMPPTPMLPTDTIPSELSYRRGQYRRRGDTPYFDWQGWL